MAGSPSLPLLARAASGDGAFVVVTDSPLRRLAQPRTSSARVGVVDARSTPRMPDRLPRHGEQYRFHFDMGACIGCKCCVVACNEQNGNPAAINWRRVSDIEGGFFPAVTKSHLSMSCNHCLEPTCLDGCPVDAYSKDPITGIVRHSADACIGCQYCTWNCSYGAPQFNPERGIVGKCDMCHGRLTAGQSPACVNACPQGAIAIEIVNVADWRASIESGPVAPANVPVGDHSLSTTRVSLMSAPFPNTRPVDITHVAPEHPHWPLVFMTVLTQLACGALTVVWLLQLLGVSTRLGVAALASLSVAGVALAASTLHLGRPAYAYRALRMWRRSWLSREVLLFTAFSGAATLYAGLLWFGIAGSAAAGAVTVVFGMAGVTASACIYRVPARPAWNTRHTLAHFHLTAGILGPLFASAAGVGETRWLGLVSAAMAITQLTLLAAHVLACYASDNLALKGTARLLSSVLAKRMLLRGALLVIGAVVIPLVATAPPVMALGLAMALGAEVLGRYLFFVSVVPQHQAAPYIPVGSEAA